MLFDSSRLICTLLPSSQHSPCPGHYTTVSPYFEALQISRAFRILVAGRQSSVKVYVWLHCFRNPSAASVSSSCLQPAAFNKEKSIPDSSKTSKSFDLLFGTYSSCKTSIIDLVEQTYPIPSDCCFSFISACSLEFCLTLSRPRLYDILVCCECLGKDSGRNMRARFVSRRRLVF